MLLVAKFGEREVPKRLPRFQVNTYALIAEPRVTIMFSQLLSAVLHTHHNRICLFLSAQKSSTASKDVYQRAAGERTDR